jgi:hypothetical protein
MSEAKKTTYRVTMPGPEITFEIPVEIIARNRAEYYKDEFGGDVERSLEEDTWPLFFENEDEISDWARNQMNYEDVYRHITHRGRRGKPDYQEGWVNGDIEIL